MKFGLNKLVLLLVFYFCVLSTAFASKDLLHCDRSGFMEKSLVILKPDCMEKRLVGKIITRFERVGLNIVDCKVMHLDGKILNEHYAHIAHLPFFPEIVEFMSSGPVIAMVVEGDNAIPRVRILLGPTDSRQALPGTIRGDFGTDKMRNIAHASDSKEAAEAEIQRFFGER
ncbi:MAG: nucleoside-diphosphate kinase [Puniceicoccales bacterium]|jgi:nucleoside-diphosphate kinase|nr:nucleoside-diphosphate kinase [Puniceicoccales bacterium]